MVRLSKISKAELVHGGATGRESSSNQSIDSRAASLASRFFGLDDLSGFKIRQGKHSTRLISPKGIGYLFVTPFNEGSIVDDINRHHELHVLAGYDVGSIYKSGFSAACFAYKSRSNR